ncbi:helicase protein [Ranunculus cassubicifolius]
MYECELTLPPSALLQKVIGPKSRNTQLAKQLVCLEACQKLHELGALNDHLLPSSEESIEDKKIQSNKDYSFGAGTTKRKELHGTTVARALSGSWGHRADDITLYAYKIDFSCNQVDEFFSGFVLLMEAKLDDDVARAEVELFLIGNKLVKSAISPYGKLQLNTEQVKNAKRFQEFFFNGLFGKLYIGSKFSGVQREFLLNDENKSLWRQSNMYMLLPLESLNSIGNFLAVDWRGINACASSVEFVKQHFSVAGENFPSKTHDDAKCKSYSDTIYLANTSVVIHDITDMVVFAIHTGKIYSVLEVRMDMSGESSFDGEFDMVPSTCRSFREYFQDK